ncbi:hypothetical protein HPB50_010079 [Hyalomma asiaticum]|uniref:Uncharacterized protein n=1 Tax=Hyalomma asiaticum TaxID=266040 RepID=A0ACB7TKB6_HYAAI|nr:hypothetical protein HPB50_010079 [Hyalomma asiaticum]
MAPLRHITTILRSLLCLEELTCSSRSDCADHAVSAASRPLRTTSCLTSLYFSARFDYSRPIKTFMDALSANSSFEYRVLSAHWTAAEPPGVLGQYIWSEAQEDLLHVPKILVIEAMFPENADIVVKPWIKVEGHVRDSYSGHRTRLFPGADGELLVFVSVKETLPECSTRKASSGRLGLPHQTAVASRCAGYWTRPFSEVTWDPFMTEVFGKGTLCDAHNTQGACTSEEAHQQEGAKGYAGSIRHPPEVVLLRNAMEGLPLEGEQHPLAAFAETGDTNAVNNRRGEEQCRPPRSASSDQVCQINDCLPVCNELLLDIAMQLREEHRTSLNLFWRSMAYCSRATLSVISQTRWLQGNIFTRVQLHRLGRQVAEPPTGKAALLLDDAEYHRGYKERRTARCLQAHAIYGYMPGLIRHPPEVILLRNAVEDLAPETEPQSLAFFAGRGDTAAVNNGGEEHCLQSCTTSNDQVSQIKECLQIWNELLFGIRLQLLEQRGTPLSLVSLSTSDTNTISPQSAMSFRDNTFLRWLLRTHICITSLYIADIEVKILEELQGRYSVKKINLSLYEKDTVQRHITTFFPRLHCTEQLTCISDKADALLSAESELLRTTTCLNSCI